MLTPHEFKRTRAARPRPDLGGDDLADLGTTGWYVGRFSTDKHLSIGKAHAVRPKIGLYWPPVVARVGRRPWRCRCGLLYWWPPVLADAVAVRRAGVRPCGWLVCWLAVRAAGVRPPCWRSVRVAGVRPWPWWPFSWPLAAFWPSAGPLVRRGPFVARGGPFWALPVVGRRGPCWLVCLPFQLVVFRRRLRPSPLVCGAGACVPCCAVGGRGGRVAGRPCWWCWCRCRCAVPWPVVRVAGRQYWPPCGGVLVVSLRRPVVGRVPWSVRPCWCPPWSVAGCVRPSVLVCWCRSVAGVRLLPCSVAVAALSGRRWCWCPSLVLAARTGRVLGLADWLAVWALPVVAAVAGGACACGGACLVKEHWSVAGWRWAVCGAFRGGGVRLPCLWSLLVTLQRRPWAVRLSKDQTPAAAVAALLVVCVTCLRWRRRRRRRWSRPCASRTTYGGRRSVCRRRCILKRRQTGWRLRRRSEAFRPCQWRPYG